MYKRKARNQWLLYVFTYVTLIIPKAGSAYGDLPITVSNVLFGIILLFHVRKAVKSILASKWMIFYFVLPILIAITIWLNLAHLNLMYVAFALVVYVSPFSLFIGRSLDEKKTMHIVAVSLIIVSVFALIQFVFGVQETQIEGITIALGENYYSKNIYRNGILRKIPSTYQNGSIVAPFYITAVCFLLQNREKSRMKTLAVILGIVGFILSGSRTCVFAVAIIIVLYSLQFLRRIFKKRKTLMLGICVLLFGTAALCFGEGLWSGRYFDQLYFTYVKITTGDATMSGRTTQWTGLLNYIFHMNFGRTVQLLFTGINWGQRYPIEGWLNILRLYGIITFLSFLAAYFILFKKYLSLFWIKFALISLTLAFFIDGSLFYPPTLINLFLILGMSDRFMNEEKVKVLFLTQQKENGMLEIVERGRRWV